MIRIAYLLQSWGIGGIETAIRNLTTYLKKKYPKQFEFHFIATNNIEIHPQFKKNGHAVYMGEKWGKIVKYLKKNNIDIVQYGNRIEYKQCALDACVPYIIERTAGPRSLGLNKDGVDNVIASTKSAVPIIQKSYNGPITVIYNGVDLKQKIISQRLGFKEDDFIVVYPSARMGDGQRYDDLIFSMTKVHKINPKAKLVLLGDHPSHAAYPNIKPRLLKLAKPLGRDCIFTGLIRDPLPIIHGANVVVCPAKTHGVSNGLLEAAAAGIPIISSNVGHAKEICTPGNGFLYPCGDIEKLAKLILKLSKDPKLCKKMGKAGRKIVSKEFDITVNARKYRQVYLSYY